MEGTGQAVTILVFLAALVQRDDECLSYLLDQALQSLFFWQL